MDEKTSKAVETGCYSYGCGCFSGGCLGAALCICFFLLLAAWGLSVGVLRDPMGYLILDVKGEAMLPAIQPDDLVLLDQDYYHSNSVNRGEIIRIFPEGERWKGAGLVLRVAGLPGEAITFDVSGELQINGEPLEDPLFKGKSFRVEGLDLTPLELSENEYYVLGDNTEKAKDSRVIGAVPIKSIRGRVTSVLYPLRWLGNMGRL